MQGSSFRWKRGLKESVKAVIKSALSAQAAGHFIYTTFIKTNAFAGSEGVALMIPEST